MNTYIAFLRGINVSGKHKIQMAELKELLSKQKLEDVKTYIQSGNVVFESGLENSKELENLISKAILSHFNFNVPVIVMTISKLKEILDQNPFKTDDENLQKQNYFVLLNEIPNVEAVDKLSNETFKTEDFLVTNDCMYLKCTAGYGKAKLNNNLVERKLKVKATTRNYRTMNKLLELSY